MTIARRRSHVSDGLVLMCVGVAGWGLAPLVSYPGLALPSVAAGVVGGVGVIGLGQRSVRRAELVESLRLSLVPLLGLGQRPAGSGLQTRRWTRGWPGQPRRVCLRYGVGRVRVGPDEAGASAGATVEIGDARWAGEVTRQVSRLLGATYRVHRHRRGQLILALRPARPDAGEAADTPAVARAKKLVNELLGGTAAIRSVEADPQTGEVIRLDVKHEVGAKLVAPGYRNRVERTVSVMLPGRWRARWDMEGDSVVFEVRPTLPECLWIEPLAAPSSDPLRDYRQVRIPYGVDEDGEVIAWQPALTPQWLITGSTGSGKTSTGHGILTQITRFGWPVWIADGKGIEFLGFQDWPNVQIVASRIEEQIAVIHRAWQLMEHRYQLVVERRARTEDFEPLALMVDEFTDLKANLLAWYGQVKVKGDPTKPPTLAEIGSIARKGRTARVHLVLSMQRPDAEILGGEALAIDTPIPSPSGWSTMGKLQVGDHVFAEDGRIVAVTATTPVLQDRPCYRVVFSDGSSIVTDANHLWAARNFVQRSGDNAAARSLTRAQRWPGHVSLADRLRRLDQSLRVESMTVAEFERAVGQGRITLLRRRIHDGRLGLQPVERRKSARVYRAGDLIDVLIEEATSAAPTWRDAEPQIVTTEQMAHSQQYRQAANWSIQVAEPLQLPAADLPIDPWLLGYWLGDGNRCAASIATADEDVLVRIRDLGYRTTHYGRYNYGISAGSEGDPPPSLKVELRRLGVLGDKHIPDIYLRASAAQRFELLAGLLDADGSCSVRRRGSVASGQVSFTNVNRHLIDQVIELVASLGFIPTARLARPAGIETHPRSVARGSRTQPAWRVAFTPDRQVFGLARKQQMLAPSLEMTRRATTRRRYVVRVEVVESVPVRCITVDSPTHLYLAGRSFIPTHNCRENFGQRTSLGPLSPEGATMMWNSPVIGVAIPRGRIGRAIGTNNQGMPVELQAYRVPDPKDAAPDSAEGELIARLRPAETRHERLLIVPPVGRGDGEGEQPSFSDFAGADWVKASDRPDLDPLAAGVAAAGGGRSLSSPLALFGLAPSARRPARAQLENEDVDVDVDGMSPAGAHVDELGDLYADGYGASTAIRASSLSVGDLVCVEEDLDGWAVVEEEPIEDLEDGEFLAIAWRDAQDVSGLLSVSADALVQVRRPV